MTDVSRRDALKAFAAQHDWGAALDRLLASLGIGDRGEVRVVDLAAAPT